MTEESKEAKPKAIADLCGEVCPMTFVKAKLHLERVAAGEVLELVLKDDEQLRSTAMSLKEEGHRIESVRQQDGRYHVLVRKGA